MIDIHSHILPDIDDGPDSYQESLAIIEESQQHGIDKIVATPHYIETQYEFSQPDITVIINKLKKKMEERNLHVDILPGAEVSITYNMGQKIAENKIIPINNSRYILLELPFVEFPEYINEVIYDIKVMNYCPIIAHPERYVPVISDIQNLQKLIEKGQVYAQLNIGSLLGRFGDDVKKVSRKLIKQNLIHFIASDVHSTAFRKQYFEEGIKILNSIDERYFKRYQANANKVINDEALQIRPPHDNNSGTFFSMIKKLFSSS